MITTMVLLVVSSVIIHGAFMPVFAQCLLGNKEPIHRGPRMMRSQRTFGTGATNNPPEEKSSAEEKLIKKELTHVHEENEEDFESEELSNDSPKNGSESSGSEYEEFKHENEQEGVEEHEQCKCEKCNPRITGISRLVAWIDHNWLKRLLVYNYSPENIKAQNDVQELFDDALPGFDEDNADGQAEKPRDLLNEMINNAIQSRVEEIQGARPLTSNLAFARQITNRITA